MNPITKAYEDGLAIGKEEGYRAGVEAMRDAALGECLENDYACKRDIRIVADKLLEEIGGGE